MAKATTTVFDHQLEQLHNYNTEKMAKEIAAEIDQKIYNELKEHFDKIENIHLPEIIATIEICKGIPPNMVFMTTKPKTFKEHVYKEYGGVDISSIFKGFVIPDYPPADQTYKSKPFPSGEGKYKKDKEQYEYEYKLPLGYNPFAKKPTPELTEEQIQQLIDLVKNMNYSKTEIEAAIEETESKRQKSRAELLELD